MADKKKNKISIKNVVACGIGTALFVVLTEVQIPIGIPNTSLQPRMAVLAFLSAIFGLYYGSVWWSWVFPEAVVGIAIGAFARKFAVSDGGFTKGKMVLFNIVQVIANAVAWIIVAPVLDIAVYAEPATKVFLQGAFAFLGNIIIIGVLGTLLLATYSKIAGKSSSLKKED